MLSLREDLTVRRLPAALRWKLHLTLNWSIAAQNGEMADVKDALTEWVLNE
jgi:hypothetical protein